MRGGCHPLPPAPSFCLISEPRRKVRSEKVFHGQMSQGSESTIFKFAPNLANDVIDTLPVCLNNKKLVEQNDEHEECFPSCLEYV